MRRPNLNRRVRLQVRKVQPDALGQDVVTWACAGEVWADVRPLRGGALIAAQAIDTRADYIVTIRSRCDAIPLQLRVVFDGITYEAVHISEPVGTRGIWQEMLVREVRHAA